MARKKNKLSIDDSLSRLEKIKKLVVVAMFSDDGLMERLVLKGGNALDLIHRISTRASNDIDFSMSGDFEVEKESVRALVESLLRKTFKEAKLEVFDVKLEEVPEGLTPDVSDFWGGYGVEFKVIEQERFDQLSGDLAALRKNAVPLGKGQSTKFSIDISKYEYTEGKEPQDLAGFRIFVYSPEMMVCEKLRAICQQMPAYAPVIKRTRASAARARDFLDIHTLVTERKIDLRSEKNEQLLRHIFEAKRVPLLLLREMGEHREFHRGNFATVKDTVKPGVVLKDFDFYFDFVLELIAKLKLDKGVS